MKSIGFLNKYLFVQPSVRRWRLASDRADFTGTVLKGADFTGADLTDADLDLDQARKDGAKF